eukprot:tig00020660_g12572.t1
MCPGASPYDFMTKAASFGHDFRHFHSSYERLFYDTASGVLGGSPQESYEWGGMLSNFFLSRINPELAIYADGSGFGGPVDLFKGTDCLDFYDAELSSPTLEGNETLADVSHAYSDLGPFQGLLLQDSRLVPFWARGAAFFGSFVGFRGSGGPAVVPLLKACSLAFGVALLKLNFTALAPDPAEYSPTARSVYPSVPWPEAGGAFFADSFPPGASLQAVRADGRVEEGGPLLYHAIVRLPLFPTAACPGALLGGVCTSLPIVHVTAALTWAVDPSSFTEKPARAPGNKYRTGVVVHSAPRILRTDTLPLADHWIVQNERPLHAGSGYGYLEGRLVDPPNGRYAFYVTGDRVVRLAKPDSYRSGMAGAVDGEVRIYGSTGWTGSRSDWTSVAAAVYKDGVLFIVQEVHTSTNTRVFAFAADSRRPRFIHSKRMGRQSERAPASRLLRLAGVDGASFNNASVAFSVLVPDFPANVLSAMVVDDYSSGRMFDADRNATFAELPWRVTPA